MHAKDYTCESRRPALDERRFTSSVVDAFVDSLATELRERNQTALACVFENTFPNTLDTTVLRAAKPTSKVISPPSSEVPPSPLSPSSFIITGDIPAMWLRDSTNQVLPYFRFASMDDKLRALLAGLVETQANQILVDPWANAHYLPEILTESPNREDSTTFPGFGPSRTDAMVPGIYERKYELDSICAFLKLSRMYFNATQDTAPFESKAWLPAVRSVISVMRIMQASSVDEEVKPGGPTYRFQRAAMEPTDSLLHGTGFPGAKTGMIRSAFRPSDDSCRLPFLVSANAMAVVELREIARVLNETSHRLGSNRFDCAGGIALASEALLLASEVDNAIRKYATLTHPTTGKAQFAYEVDGFGNALFMDDANVPSLLSLPYLGYISNRDPLYKQTRSSIWSGDTNPYYFAGDAGEGIGGPHVGLNMIWPMSIIMKALTSDNAGEIKECLDVLLTTTAGTGLMHESFDKNNAGSYTRPWFAWANSLFGELVVRIAKDMPSVLGLPEPRSVSQPSDQKGTIPKKIPKDHLSKSWRTYA